MKVIAPDGSLTLTSRNGTGHLLTTVKQGSTINLARTTDNDGLGRLFSVREPSGPTAAAAPAGADVITKYGYDFADRLAFVDIGGTEGDQTRRFIYDRRGFLSSEQHPESGQILRTMGKMYVATWRYHAAFDAYTRWVTLNPGSGEAWEKRAQVWEHFDSDNSAEKDYRKSLEVAPYRYHARFLLVQLLLRLNRDPKERVAGL